MTRTIFEKSEQDQHAYSLPKNAAEFLNFKPKESLLRKEVLALPEVSELNLTRHFNEMANRNVGIDNIFYPLGSCTMKFNPRVNELVAGFDEFTKTHPLASTKFVQGNLEIIFELIEMLAEVSGMAGGTILPNAGAQGEFVGIRMIADYHNFNKNNHKLEVLIPDNAHGTNPATAKMAGYTIVSIRTNSKGDIDLEHLKSLVSDKTAALMLTNPNTLGLFSPTILEVTKIIHDHDGLLYYDGANLNAILNIAKPCEMGFDLMHINLHKTFSTPHGGGGPGSGPVLCNKKLLDFLPVPRVEKTHSGYKLGLQSENSIGSIASFHGNFSIYLRAYLYMKLHGNYGLRRISEQAVLNANYLKSQMAPFFNIPYPQPCMHEFVVSVDTFLDKGVRALDIAKRLLDYGVHAPTIYFPLIIKECMLIEPTESESKATLDNFINILKTIVQEINDDPELIKNSPHTTPVKRLDEIRAAKSPILKF